MSTLMQKLEISIMRNAFQCMRSFFLWYYNALEKDLNYQTSNIVDISLPAIRLKPVDPVVTACVEEDIMLSLLSFRFSL